MRWGTLRRVCAGCSEGTSTFRHVETMRLTLRVEVGPALAVTRGQPREHDVECLFKAAKLEDLT